MIWQGPAFAIIMHIFAYIFNIILLIMLKLVHSRVYMFNMILSEIVMNLSQNILIEFPYFFPQDSAFYSFRHVKFIEIFSQMAYQGKFLIAILMSVNRLWVVVKPIGSEAFSSNRLVIYTVVGWVVLFFRQMIIIIPDDCYYKMDLVQFQVMAVCEDMVKHERRMEINKYISYFIHIVLPWSAVIINGIVFICIKARKHKNKIYRNSGEHALVINSFVISLYLTANYIYNYCYSLLKPYISEQSHGVQSAFSFFNLYGCSCFNFVVYFLLDPSNRLKVIYFITNKKPNKVGTTVTLF